MAPPLARLTLVLGGARSGKSRYAEGLLKQLPPPWHYVATGEARDAEMGERIAHHAARRGPQWVVHETPLELAATLGELGGGAAPVLVDCMTLWLSNIMLAGRDADVETGGLRAALSKMTSPVVVVSNEVGLGIVPDNALARAFRDAQGRLNAAVAADAAHVVLVAAGLPLVLKQS